MSTETCIRCGVTGLDRRTLWMACMYEMLELGVPFEMYGTYGTVGKLRRTKTGAGSFEFENDISKKNEEQYQRNFYTLTVCKGCRSDWMQAIKAWFRTEPSQNARWNNDECLYDENDTLPKMLAEMARLNAEYTALGQRIRAATGDLQTEEERREKEKV